MRTSPREGGRFLYIICNVSVFVFQQWDNNTTADDDADDEVSNKVADDGTAVPVVDSVATPTGDSNHITLWMILAIAAFTGVVIYGIIYRKKFK